MAGDETVFGPRIDCDIEQVYSVRLDAPLCGQKFLDVLGSLLTEDEEFGFLDCDVTEEPFLELLRRNGRRRAGLARLRLGEFPIFLEIERLDEVGLLGFREPAPLCRRVASGFGAAGLEREEIVVQPL